MVFKKRLSFNIRYWSKCNNKCTFCFEDSDTYTNIFCNPSVEAIDANNAVVKRMVNESNYDTYAFKLLGGELFYVRNKEIIKRLADTVDWIYDVYDSRGIIPTLDKAKDGFCQETLLIASTLLYKEPDAMNACLDVLASKPCSIHPSMMLSYDLHGRFIRPGMADRYYKNYCDIVNNYPGLIRPVVSFLFSRQNMEILANQTPCRELEIFDELYNMGAPFDGTLLYNDSHIDYFAYTVDQLHAFVDVLFRKYPRILRSFVNIFGVAREYHSHVTTRVTVQGGAAFSDNDFFEKDKTKDHKCLCCSEYSQCVHCWPDISYNVTHCDVREIIRLYNANRLKYIVNENEKDV